MFSCRFISHSLAGLFHNLTESESSPVSIKALDVLCRATMTRTGFRTVPDFKQHLSILNVASQSSEAFLVHPYPEWYNKCAVEVLERTCDSVPIRDVVISRSEDITFGSTYDSQS